jgi:integrase
VAITDAWLKANNARPRDAVEERADRDGLGVRVSKKGKIVFQLRYRHNGKPARLDIGTYPLITLKQARDEAMRFRADLEKGHDPRVMKKVEKAGNAEALNLEALYRKWHDAYCVPNKKGHREIMRSFEIYVFPKLGKIPPGMITADNWLTLLEDMSKTVPKIADRILTNTKQMLSWSMRRKLIKYNVLSDVNAKADLNIVKKVKVRSLSDEEIKMLYDALDHSRMAPKNRLYIKLCLIYGCRNGELRLSKKRDFDFESMIWTVPPENHKTGKATGRPLLRPITDDIKELVQQCFLLNEKGEYLFSNSGASTIMGRSASLALPYNIMQWLRRNRKYEMQHWSIHDLRKTARTNFSKLTEPHVAEILLGHRLPGEWQTYDFHDYIDEQAECLRKWVSKIKEITSP